MALTTNEYVKYNTTGHFYYLTVVGATAYTGIESLEEFCNDKRLETQGRLLHQEYVKSAHNGKQLGSRNMDIIEYNVFANEKGERQAIIDSLTNFALVSYHYDLDIDIMNGDKKFTDFILDPIKDARVYYKGEMLGEVPEDEYRVGY